LFVGCSLGDEAHTALARLAAEVRKGLEGQGWRASWTKPAMLHLTMKFVGDVEPDRAPALVEAMRAACAESTPIAVAVEDLGTFPPRGRPKILFSGIGTGREECVALAAAIEERFAALGIPRESRPFHPHVTLARVREAPRTVTLPPVTRIDGAFTEVVLWRSELLPAGARYSRVASIALGG
jgi:2'-5' RNA ligase